ncbi:UDP-N-acetylglucosamine--N-acetylmuramyl-(pentapeptide) pyrophosphoryl-undecaprenol N-acetylglucosamine transferase [Sporosarcina luteola]|uniref:UDP-N-acetylglucosamine--N-acetylmuramyl-(pentapeptide) pyrophosphoryl-undecaprenol N-acetylglucosamine transferase n=1 Tax=Sporosarcina luteola TaxID=582850 RepID=A0A511Z5B2_9BACL|nr:undecaprenyldiphospho-muramoylpentapeptide beta-N-acetylglucosaminyltransferase [Sporosarcina luteola]GEN82645.1 UDP-N-acetylglucosamine--N-acetylmuramyl-(pentapeptide) pyrophosphoryl-undecaprenol N-acetylglucosamine transferase [Sporosarcina luteola]
MKRPVIVLTGGGTAGHVSVNEALIPVFIDKGYEVHYIGSHDGIEKELIKDRHREVTYHAIQSGKLRRYFSMKNFSDPFRVGAGVVQAFSILRKLKPEIIFSKGGFVSVPVVLAAKLAKIPVVVHESDVTPGLANKLALPFSNHIFTVFEQTLEYLPVGKATCTGAVIRPEIFEGIKEEGLRIAGLTGTKPVFIVMGGSQGSALLNDATRKELTTILDRFEVIHLCGKGNIDESLERIPGYTQFEYVTEGLPHLLAAADYAVSRAGSNAIFELLSVHKPMLLIPLSAAQSRGDQLLNASLFKSLGIAETVLEEELENSMMVNLFSSLEENKNDLVEKMQELSNTKSPEMMADLILSYKN